MVRLTGQLLSLAASGSLGKIITYSNWKGRAYAKKFSVPTNNQQLAQLGMRAAMGFLSKQWTLISTSDRDSWNAAALAKHVSEFDAFVGYNLKRTAENLAPTKAMPEEAVSYNPAAVGQAVTPFPTFVNVAFFLLSAPEGWTMTIYRNDVSGFEPLPENMVHLASGPFAPTLINIRDVPPSRGTWYYRWKSGDPFGNQRFHVGEGTAVWT